MAAVTNRVRSRATTSMSSTRARHREPGSQPGGAVIEASEFIGDAVGLIRTAGAKPPKLADKDTSLAPVLRTLVLRPGPLGTMTSRSGLPCCLRLTGESGFCGDRPGCQPGG